MHHKKIDSQTATYASYATRAFRQCRSLRRSILIQMQYFLIVIL